MRRVNDDVNGPMSVEMIINEKKSTTSPETHSFLTDDLGQIGNEQKKSKKFHPKEWLNGLRSNPKYPLFVKGDIDGFIVLFTNNLATLLVIILSARPILGDDIVYGRMVPG